MSDDDTRANDGLMNISPSVELGYSILDLIITGIPKSAFIHQSTFSTTTLIIIYGWFYGEKVDMCI